MKRFLHRLAHWLYLNDGEVAIWWDDDTHTTTSTGFHCYGCGDTRSVRRITSREPVTINYPWPYKSNWPGGHR